VDVVNSTVNQRGRIAAVFDIDGTLLPAPSLELRLLADLALARKLRLRAIGAWLRILAVQSFGVTRNGRKNPMRTLALDENKAYWEGMRIGIVDAWIAREIPELEFFSDALELIDWHRRRGHAIVLISGTLAPLARAVGTLLAGDAEIFVRATKLESAGDRWTGRVIGEAICGPAKERALMQLAAENNFDLSRSYAYANSWKDLWLLRAVGRAIAVNAGPRLAQHARRCGWRLVNWSGSAVEPASRKCASTSAAENGAQVFAEKLLWK
jgi:HAD superfamily hydrolase (TIGR01490 family)